MNENLIVLSVYVVGFIVTFMVAAKRISKGQLDFDDASVAGFFALCWPILAPFVLAIWLLMVVYNLIRGVREESSPVYTPEFTVPLKQVGTGWGHGKTRWYRP